MNLTAAATLLLPAMYVWAAAAFIVIVATFHIVVIIMTIISDTLCCNRLHAFTPKLSSSGQSAGCFPLPAAKKKKKK